MEKILFVNNEVLPPTEICIVIPVKNEEKHIAQTLKAFSAQTDLDGNPFNFELCEILILANNCTDDSVEIIKEFQKENRDLTIYLEEVSLPKNLANIGYVRKILFDTACRRLLQNRGGIIMTTDGDTTVACDWISQNVQEINAGAEAVGGRILLCSKEIPEMNAQTYAHHLKDEKYQLLVAALEAEILQNSYDPSPRHHQHFNGSFAVTTACYLKSGGIPNVTYLEDVAFFEKLQLIDAKVRHSYNVMVHTSARCIGRTEVGLSYQLNKWENSGICKAHFFVEPCTSIIERLMIKKQLMKLWEMKNITELEFKKQIETILPAIKTNSSIYTDFSDGIYFGKWYATLLKYVEIPVRKHRLELIDEVIAQLEHIINDYSAATFSQTSIR